MLLLVVAPLCHFLSLSLKNKESNKKTRRKNKTEGSLPPPGLEVNTFGRGGVGPASRRGVQGGTQQFSSDGGGGGGVQLLRCGGGGG